ncbi:hypothetical protein AOLI_G00187650 [Acnodon oligacanthus]
MKMTEVDGRPHLCLFAIEDIKQGDEITYDYGEDAWPWQKKVKEDTISKSNARETQPTSLSEPVLSTCSSPSNQVREDAISKSTIKESQPPYLSEPVLSTSSSAGDQDKENIASKTNAKTCHPPSQTGPFLATYFSASDQTTGKDAISDNSAQENNELLQSGPVLSAEEMRQRMKNMKNLEVKHLHRKEENLGK